MKIEFMLTVSILVPAYNERATIIQLLTEVREQKFQSVEFEVIVIDDGSTDGTTELLESNPQLYDKLIKQPRNAGKGAAVLAGLQNSSGQYVLFQDADLEYSPSYYKALLQPVLAFGAEIVMGSRFLTAEYVRVQFFWHKIGNKAVTTLFNVFFNTTFTDLYTGYLLYRRDLVNTAELTSKG